MRRLFNRIYKIIRYIPVLWKDEDWEWTYLFLLLEKKLSLMEIAIREGYNIHSDKIGDEIKRARLMCHRIYADEYARLHYKAHQDKWGQLNSFTTPSSHNLLQMHFYYPNAKTDEEYKKASKEAFRIYQHEEYLRKQDLQYLFSYLARNIQKWWD